MDLGTFYLSDTTGKSFVHCIFQSRRQGLVDHLKKAKFFSLILDGSTDKGNTDNELVLAVWCEIDGKDERIHIKQKMGYFTVSRPQAVTADGIFSLLESTIQKLEIESITEATYKKLVILATDGASANIAASGLKGLVERQLSWIFWMWCLAHRLELAIKDALKGTTFDEIDDILLKLYYLNKKSPKKCRELAEIVSDLKDCLTFDDHGETPVGASDT